MRGLPFLTGLRRREALPYPGRGLLWLRLAVGVAAVLLVAAFALSQGSVDIPLGSIVRILISRLPGVEIEGHWPQGWETIVWEIRLPRVVLAGLVGMTLALSGTTYQGLFRNPLADPYLLGVAAGAGLGATLAIVFPLEVSLYRFSTLTLLAFAGALGATGLAYALARVGRTVPLTTLILAGVAISAVASALTSFLMLWDEQNLRVIFTWLLGGFNASSWDKAWLLFPYLLPAAALILAYGRILNVLQLDEEQAQQLGVAVERVKLLLIGAASLASAAAVSVSGLIGFVGLVVPHMARLLWGPDHRQLLPMAMVLGAIVLILADLLARTIIAPAEMPIGIVTAIGGGPFFLYLLRQRKRTVF